jgi:hypothetical protein
MLEHRSSEVDVNDVDAVCPSEANNAYWARCLSVIPENLEELLRELDLENSDY